MSVSTKKTSNARAAQKKVAQQAKQAAKVLQSFTTSVLLLEGYTPPKPVRNWWRSQAGRFSEDPTFAEFVAQVQAARKKS